MEEALKFIGARLSRAEWVPGDGAKGAGALWGPQKSSGPSAPSETGAGDHVPAGIRAQDHDEGRLRHLGHARDALLECSGTRTPGWGTGAELMCSPQQRHFGVQLPSLAPEAAHTPTDKKKKYILKKILSQEGEQGRRGASRGWGLLRSD